ncbi:MAG: hypothetical protein H7A21_10325 [Spirochaetales bacterium]|nr:hypothetical protein [Leptospiraceae bacterium]MCP5481818.1 hypothetical protein [Spirochaetales bacterium]
MPAKTINLQFACGPWICRVGLRGGQSAVPIPVDQFDGQLIFFEHEPYLWEVVVVRSIDDTRLRVLLARFSPGLKGGGVLAPPTPLGDAVHWETFLMRDSADPRRNVVELLTDLGRIATDGGAILKAVLVEVHARPPEGEGDPEDGQFAYLEICAAGLPPVAVLHEGQLTFPVRSWFPAGLVEDWRPWLQTLECVEGDRLFVHSEWESLRPTLREFHAMLADGTYENQEVTSLVCVGIERQ